LSLHVDLCLFLSRIVASVCRSSLTIYLYVREASLLYTIPVCTNFSRCCQFGNGRFLKVEELLMDKKEKKKLLQRRLKLFMWTSPVLLYSHALPSFMAIHFCICWTSLKQASIFKSCPASYFNFLSRISLMQLMITCSNCRHASAPLSAF